METLSNSENGGAPRWKRRLTIPAYRVGEAASYARISPQTVANWERSTFDKISVVSGRRERTGLNFLQLIEVAVVANLRREGLRTTTIRDARTYFSQALNSVYPFALEKFKTDGAEILIETSMENIGSVENILVSASANGQLVWADFLQRKLKEFNYGDDGVVEAWHLNGPTSEIVIDPKISFGAPSVRGVMTRAIKGLFSSGTSIDDISDDYDLPTTLVREALVFEGFVLESDRIH